MDEERICYLSVPMPLHGVDDELNLMASLQYVMEHLGPSNHAASADVRRRAAAWLAERYANQEPAD